MKISLSWLKEYVDIGDMSVEDLVNNLTMSGLEVEDYVDQRDIYKDFVVGYVKEKIKQSAKKYRLKKKQKKPVG
ncbi:MAG: hypothetical protein IIB83_07630 [Bacteroidetes bacterium]|nr:hypothetical protein [Bacteroidota bacterium]